MEMSLHTIDHVVYADLSFFCFFGGWGVRLTVELFGYSNGVY